MNEVYTDESIASDAEQAPAAPASPFDKLTRRELQVCRGIAVGAKYADIAAALGISTRTIDTHRAHAFVKLGCENNVELARMALRAGAVTLDSDEWRS